MCFSVYLTKIDVTVLPQGFGRQRTQQAPARAFFKSRFAADIVSNDAFPQVLFYKHGYISWMIRCNFHKKRIGPRKSYWFFPVFFLWKRKEMGKNELKEARKILYNVLSGSFFNSLRPSPNVELFIRRAKFSELPSWKVRRLPKLTSSEWVWIIQHVLSALHWKTSPVKTGLLIRLCEEKRGFKGYRRFQTLMKFTAISNYHTFKREYRKKRSRLALF